ncbi:hypothetical protein BcepSauron_106 [Burkholderia phage BcepSauron]|uniref:Uncharacterized protein n=1 Tax=Burkholderia phage BcepSauron TaxID=2530033 RepID=A0A482MLW3_9CAUD|nr:hypothetical protein H1O17_gp106 [Burkholderia phage BcepSauron]QBQ74486.1 hypothetical protein BcepSauron_106 [Burkholderia phage BcepSauron]
MLYTLKVAAITFMALNTRIHLCKMARANWADKSTPIEIVTTLIMIPIALLALLA